MSWELKNTSDNTVLASSDFGCYLLDVVSVTEGKGSTGTFPTAIKNKTTSYDYSSSANRIYPIVIPRRVDAEGWTPTLDNWTGATDTTFSVTWKLPTGADTDNGDGGYIILLLGASDTVTTGLRVKFWVDGGTNQYISTNRCPMRYLSNTSQSVSNGSSANVSAPTTNGTAVLTDITIPFVVASTTSTYSVTPNLSNYTIWTGSSGTGGSASLYWFSSRVNPSNTETGAKFLTRDTSNRVLIDTRSYYLRILDIQIVSHSNSSSTSNGTTLATFSNDVPATANGTYAIISNIGSSTSSINMDGRAIKLQGASRLPDRLIFVAVNIGDIS